jgi:microsomal dipeptidase-like Zn-dependent dipeptidase
VQPLQSLLVDNSKHKMSATKLAAIASDVPPTYTTFTSFTKKLTFDAFMNAPLSFNILTKESFNNPLPKNKVNIFFLVEGCHSLVDSINKITGTATYSPAEILSNLDILLITAKIVSINITHLQQSSLCNHAFAMQIADVTHFIPLGDGLADDGRKVIQGMFNRGISVDLKHMSYKSRLDFRNDMDSGKYQNPQVPLCSHVGFTGISFADWVGNIQRLEPVSDSFYIELVKPTQNDNTFFDSGTPAFNLSTINLFDEEIAWIVKNGGMIGLSLDRRILGYVSANDDRPTGHDSDSLLFVDKEYISKSEWTSLGLDGAILGKLITDNINDYVTADIENECLSKSQSTVLEYYSDHVLMHIQHYFQVCFDADIPMATAGKSITIGSDFDGLINPFVNIESVEAVKSLKQYILTNLPFCLDSSQKTKVWREQLDIKSFGEDLFYNNGFNFIKNWFNQH